MLQSHTNTTSCSRIPEIHNNLQLYKDFLNQTPSGMTMYHAIRFISIYKMRKLDSISTWASHELNLHNEIVRCFLLQQET